VSRRPAVLGAPAAIGAVALIAATGKGLYVSPDAVFYVGTARNLLDGHGFTPPPGLPPLQHFPPLFTVLLAAIGRLGMEPLTAARVVNVVAYVGVVLLVGLVVRAQTGSVGAGLVASVLAACAVDLLTYSASALTEPLFVLLAVAALVALAAHLDRPSMPLLVGAAGLVAAACLTRYVGIALVVAGVIGLLWRRRWADGGLFAAIVVVPLAAWFLWSGSRGSDRSLSWHLFGADYLGQAARPLSRWLVPWPRPPIGLLLALVLVVVLWRAGTYLSSSLNRLLGLFAVTYLAVLLANRALTDVTGRLDARFLVPLHVVAILVVVPALHARKLPVPALALVAVLVLAQFVDAAVWTAGGLTDGGVARRGYNAAALRDPVVLDDPGGPLHSNAPDAVFFLTGRTSGPIPARKDYLTGTPNPHYAEELAALRSTGGYVLWFEAITFRRSFQPSEADLERDLPLEVVSRDAVGTLYRIR